MDSAATGRLQAQMLGVLTGPGTWLVSRAWRPSTEACRRQDERRPAWKLFFWKEVNIFSKRAPSHASF